MKTTNEPQRACPACSAEEKIREGEAIWPIGWHCPRCRAGLPERCGIPLLAADLAETKTGFDSVTFDRLAHIKSSHFWFVARNDLLVGLSNRYFPKARRYLEIGCGNGAVLRAMSNSRSWHVMVGSDLHPAGLTKAREHLPADIELVQLDARAIPAVRAFDLIGAYDIVEHVADDEAVLKTLHCAVSAGGGVIMAVPQHPWLWSRSDEIGHHQRRYRIGELEAKLERNGFEVLFSSSYTVVLLPLMAISRLKARANPRHADTDATREISVSGPLNSALTTLLRAKAQLTLAGIRWPFGGSRIVVARAV